MTPGLWGLVTALGWGGAHFAARFTGQALGYRSATFGMLLTGSVLLSLWLWPGGILSPAIFVGAWLLVFSGLTTLVGTLLLYNGLARGPVSVVAPLVGSYPAPVVAFAVVGGARPDAIHWAAMVVTLVGVVLVA